MRSASSSKGAPKLRWFCSTFTTRNYYVVTRAAVEENQDKLREMKAYLEGLAQPIRETGLAVRTEVLIGDPAATIIRYLKDNPAQLLAMSTRGRTGLSRMIFGSVAESVIRLVKHTPLLLVAEEE